MPAQLRSRFLEQRLTPGQGDQPAAKGCHLFENLRYRVLRALIVGVARVTIAAAQVAAGETHKHTGPSGMDGFALNAVKDFINLEEHVSFLDDASLYQANPNS
ncbi:hypothetical protein DESC_300024 [Desulfosarcina cetonica]|nr:hypothetical protein DESC_300024 [Desulfosarcina cetonica]